MTKKNTFTDTNSNIIDLREKRKNLVKDRFVKDPALSGTEPYESIRKLKLRGDVEQIKEIEAKILAYNQVCDLLFATEFLNDKVQFDEVFTVLLQVYELHNKAHGYYLEADSIEQKHKFEQAEKVQKEKAELRAAKKEEKPKAKKVYHKPRKFTLDE
ncbi:TPA: hypothetical protein ACGR77_002684 [Pseudomonas aeruginosa]